MYRNPFSQDDWYGVIIFPSRNLEPKNTTIHQPLLNSNKVRVIYLDELDDSEEQSIGMSVEEVSELLGLTIEKVTQAAGNES